MTETTQDNAYDYVLDEYRQLVSQKHGDNIDAWPILSGCNPSQGTLGELWVFLFKHTGQDAFRSVTGLGEIPRGVAGVGALTSESLEAVRRNIVRHYRLTAEDGVVFLHSKPDGGGTFSLGFPNGELERLLLKHEAVMGFAPMKIFLSHKSADKTMLRDYQQTLEALGFTAWFDENSMNVGDDLERSLLQGFEESCAVIFFITENFLDQDYIATEVNYAVAQKRQKGDKFAIITLLFPPTGDTVTVPPLLRTYLHRQPTSPLHAIREILRALPIQVGQVSWR